MRQPLVTCLEGKRGKLWTRSSRGELVAGHTGMGTKCEKCVSHVGIHQIVSITEEPMNQGDKMTGPLEVCQPLSLAVLAAGTWKWPW